MSILIKGMDVPHDCLECYVAQFCKEYQDEENKRPYGCPLVEISTPHGRLIDADAIIVNRNDYYTSDDFMEAVNMLEDAPTIIEAEEQEHEHID